MSTIWKPNVTVAAVLERAGKFLLVEEETEDGLRFNQPAGHLDDRESLLAAVAREALEETETAQHFVPQFLVGVCQWRHLAGGITYLRFAFGGELVDKEASRTLDNNILRAVWHTPKEIAAELTRHPALWSSCSASTTAWRAGATAWS